MTDKLDARIALAAAVPFLVSGDTTFRPYMPTKPEPTEESHKFRIAKREAKMRRRAERYAKASQSQAEGTDD